MSVPLLRNESSSAYDEKILWIDTEPLSDMADIETRIRSKYLSRETICNYANSVRGTPNIS